MERFLLATVVVSLISGWTPLTAQSNHPKMIAEQLRGSSLKWIHAAEPEFAKRKLDLDKYIIFVGVGVDSVVVTLSPPDFVEGMFGSSGSYPTFEVEISKKDMKVLRSNFIR